MNRNDPLIDHLEQSINKLKLEYDIFFNGGADQFPQKLHEGLDAEVKRLFNNQSLTYAQRFRLNTLASRLSVYNDLWQRNLRLIEQGKKPSYGMRKEAEPARRVEVPIASEADRESIDLLFEAFCRARERAGNDNPVDPLRFEELVTNRLRNLKNQRACSEVVFVISLEEGEVRLKTRAQ